MTPRPKRARIFAPDPELFEALTQAVEAQGLEPGASPEDAELWIGAPPPAQRDETTSATELRAAALGAFLTRALYPFQADAAPVLRAMRSRGWGRIATAAPMIGSAADAAAARAIRAWTDTLRLETVLDVVRIELGGVLTAADAAAIVQAALAPRPKIVLRLRPRPAMLTRSTE